eukprot:TRINITY_DN12435_c0_g2_i1.p1 TRINITY_DN12435_c0_g2~~TRINITY_DN12435_c0_g2_i1.p1  ORF type:complete len:147 (+),score=4.68 TRINITY_DN12435_c0_g2_i1:133-573(+)
MEFRALERVAMESSSVSARETYYFRSIELQNSLLLNSKFTGIQGNRYLRGRNLIRCRTSESWNLSDGNQNRRSWRKQLLRDSARHLSKDKTLKEMSQQKKHAGIKKWNSQMAKFLLDDRNYHTYTLLCKIFALISDSSYAVTTSFE